MDPSLAFASLHQLAALVHRLEVSPVELAEHHLERLEACDPILNSFLSVTPDRALAAARAAEAAALGGHYLGPLHGVPLALKDLIDVAGLPTTAGSLLYKGRVAGRDAWAAHRLFQAGGVLLGKTQMVEFAYGGVGINHHYGTPWNPWDPLVHRIPGGSSSGSAVAVAAGLAVAALGSDTGGSVRIPASFCGLVGLKPTFGRISNAGVLPLDPRLDSVGPMARTVRDAALLYQAMAGPDPDDPDTWGHACEDVLEELDADIAGMRVCLPRQYFWEDVDPEVDAAVRASAQVFAGQGAQVEEIALEELDQLAELRARGSTTPPRVYLHYREHLERDLDQFDPFVSSRMLEGRRMGAVEYLELDQAYARLRQRAVRSLGRVDALLTPTTPCAALPLEQADRDDRYAAVNSTCLRNTVVANLWGLCAVSLPCGATRGGLPIGLQLVGRPFAEAAILRLAHAFEQSTSWHLRHPRVEPFSRGA